eukprot:1207766-Alexandrium_andersonii.AAC.1
MAPRCRVMGTPMSPTKVTALSSPPPSKHALMLNCGRFASPRLGGCAYTSLPPESKGLRRLPTFASALSQWTNCVQDTTTGGSESPWPGARAVSESRRLPN